MPSAEEECTGDEVSYMYLDTGCEVAGKEVVVGTAPGEVLGCMASEHIVVPVVNGRVEQVLEQAVVVQRLAVMPVREMVRAVSAQQVDD